jgi:hypothetical protein
MTRRADPPKCRAWRCHACGEILHTWTGAQRHADAHAGSGARLDCVQP